ncbi:MAG: DUF2752 domain-containing protein [Ignavibacteria bacterium]|nr:DUF2752 domain-containing protein [Ignavibacteria bacterium]
MRIGRRLSERQKAWILLIGVVFFAAFLFIYNSKTMHFLPRCPFFWATGYYCPGCGTTRGLHRLLHGDFIGALHANILMIVTVPYILYSFISYLFLNILSKNLPPIIFKPIVVQLLAAFTIVFWLVRNIPVYPFTLLIP